MIQPIAAMAVSLPGGGTSGASSQSPFMALFAQALAGQAQPGEQAGEQAGGALLAALPGAGLEPEAWSGQVPGLLEGELSPEGGGDLGAAAVLAALLAGGDARQAAVPQLSPDEDAALPAGRHGNRPGGRSLPLPLAEFAGRPGKTSGQPLTGQGPQAIADNPLLADGMALSNAVQPQGLAKALPGPLPDMTAPPATAHSVPAGIAHPGPAAVPGTAMPDRLPMVMTSEFGSPAWRQEFGDKLVWMAGRNGQFAELTLNPPNLGTVEVRLNLSGGEAGAQFYSSHPSVRDAIEAALPRLRELMAGAGISLGEATVSNQPFQHKDAERKVAGEWGGTGAEPTSSISATDGAVPTVGAGLVDYYA